MDTKGEFYLGRVFDPAKAQTSEKMQLYDPADLTTHGVVVGMTGSGKTGLCIGMLEEAALNGIPALMIDPKGDITNALLHFPDLLPQDFRPWVNPDQARQEGKSLDQAAADTAAMWRDGLAQWDIQPDRIQALKESANFAIYTPGSDAGIPVSILASFEAPDLVWEDNREMLREKISGTVTAILGLVGFQDIDPVRSREHILLSNIFENSWKEGKDLDLGELIMQTQTPPFEKLGVFDVNTFFPEKERFGLAMSLNSILAAPSFQTWIEGQPLNIRSLLYAPDGRPKHSVFYIAHLSEAERMFFVTLLFSAVESWMRSQSGTTTLRAIVYFDEIFGYMPPISNPPAKQPMLRMLKQARAFGVGLVLVTQNPVDIDYKALSNAGTWFIGKLQTDQDKQRLLDGLEGAMSGSLDRRAYDRLISSLGKRVFLLHNVHGKGGQLFQTRWAMNYLAGPLTRTQIPALNQLAGAELPSAPAPVPAAGPAAAAEPTTPGAAAPPPVAPGRVKESRPAQVGTWTNTRPAVPMGMMEYFLPSNQSFNQSLKSAAKTLTAETRNLGLVYRPVLLAQVSIRFLNRQYGLDFEQRPAAMVKNPDRRGVVRWEDFPAGPFDPVSLDDKPDPDGRFSQLDAPLSDAKILKALEKDFVDWAFRSARLTVRANEELKVYAGPDETEAGFRKLCTEAARRAREAELDKIEEAFKKKVKALETKLDTEERELAKDESDLSARKMDELGTAAQTVMSLFGRRKKSLSTSLTKRRMTSQAKADVEESLETIADLKKQISTLEKEKEQALLEANQRWDEIVAQDSEVTVTPLKKDVLLDLFGIAWMPFYLVGAGEQVEELAAFQ